MSRIVSALLLIAAVIHLLPVSGVLGAERIAMLYGISLGDPNLQILMRHRAVLFGLLGLFLVAAAFRPAVQAIATITGLVSAVSFLFLAWSAGEYNAALQRVVIADVVATVALVIAGALLFVSRHRRPPTE
ncbi:MAG: phosphopantetheine adenylyltransferase [Gammaproteobacteria bacterium]